MNLYHVVRNTIVRDGILQIHLVVAPTLKRAEELYAGKNQLEEKVFSHLYENGEITVEQIYANVHATIEKVSLLHEKYFTNHNFVK